MSSGLLLVGATKLSSWCPICEDAPMERSYYRMSDPSLIHNTQTEQHSSSQTPQAPEAPSFPWIRHYEEGVPAQLTIPERPLTWLLDNAATRYPNQTAILYYGSRLTY